ncbi:DUF2335 domain-containing protein, partial [Escherichia coli]|nr:DUF2335 domain-containing protein [Escherichia coli]
ADSIDIARDGQTKAFWLAILIILAATVFGVMGETVLAGTLVSIDLVALVTAFIVGKHYSKQEPDQD